MTDKILCMAGRHWFYLLLPLLFAATLGFRATHPWATEPRLGMVATLFDWCLFVPLLHAICYRDMPRRALALRTLATACGGIWLAGKVIPLTDDPVVTGLGWLRGLGIAILAVSEAVALVAILRVAFGATPDPAVLERQGIPPLLVRLMLAEARFWRRIWAWLAGR